MWPLFSQMPSSGSEQVTLQVSVDMPALMEMMCKSFWIGMKLLNVSPHMEIMCKSTIHMCAGVYMCNGIGAEEVRQRHVTFMNILISLVLIHDSPYKIVHSVFLIDGLFRCKLQAFPESTTCENPV